MKVWLVGMMGSGKSSVGRRSAEMLGFEFVDIDDVVEESAHMSIGDIWADKGEEGFRDLEQIAIAAVTGNDRVVVATGGGAVLSPTNREAISRSGTVIWLKGSPETLADRAANSARPLLVGATPVVDQLTRLLAERERLYAEVADHVVDADLSFGDVVDAVVTLCRH